MTHPEKGAFFMPDEAKNTGLSQESEDETMRKRFFDLQLFADSGEGGAGAAGREWQRRPE